MGREGGMGENAGFWWIKVRFWDFFGRDSCLVGWGNGEGDGRNSGHIAEEKNLR